MLKKDWAQKQTTNRDNREDKEEEKKKKTRRAVVVLLMATVGLAFFFHFLSFLPGTWQEFKSPVIIRSDGAGAPIKVLIEAPIEKSVRRLVGQAEGVYGICIVDLDKGDTFGVNRDEVFSAASLMKLPLIYAFYQQVELGEIDPDEQYSLKEGDKVDGTGSVYLQPAGTVYTLRDLVVLLGKQSDNTAQNVLVEILGEEKIQAAIVDIGMERTSYDSGETTPQDVATFWQKLATGQILTATHSQEILDSLTDTIFEEQIPAGLPEGVRVAHKVGVDEKTLHDGGVVFTDQPFVLVLKSKDVDISVAKELFPEITELVWDERGE